jgi:hypothetical protein
METLLGNLPNSCASLSRISFPLPLEAADGLLQAVLQLTQCQTAFRLLMLSLVGL